uniref:Protein phosphatase 1 regulatory subunit 1B n=1 Tax=Gasterosteus aculeatus aculeatus TaxID=481459 RepID=A0AAQ4PJB5_GASAC
MQLQSPQRPEAAGTSTVFVILSKFPSDLDFFFLCARVCVCVCVCCFGQRCARSSVGGDRPDAMEPLLPADTDVMEPEADKDGRRKIQFSVPSCGPPQLDPLQVEMIRRRRPTPATLFRLTDPPSPEEDIGPHQWVLGENGALKAKLVHTSTYEPPSLKEDRGHPQLKKMILKHQMKPSIHSSISCPSKGCPENGPGPPRLHGHVLCGQRRALFWGGRRGARGGERADCIGGRARKQTACSTGRFDRKCRSEPSPRR